MYFLWSASGGLPTARRERYIKWPLLLLLYCTALTVAHVTVFKQYNCACQKWSTCDHRSVSYMHKHHSTMDMIGCICWMKCPCNGYVIHLWQLFLQFKTAGETIDWFISLMTTFPPCNRYVIHSSWQLSSSSRHQVKRLIYCVGFNVAWGVSMLVAIWDAHVMDISFTHHYNSSSSSRQQVKQKSKI